MHEISRLFCVTSYLSTKSVSHVVIVNAFTTYLHLDSIPVYKSKCRSWVTWTTYNRKHSEGKLVITQTAPTERPPGRLEVLIIVKLLAFLKDQYFQVYCAPSFMEISRGNRSFQALMTTLKVYAHIVFVSSRLTVAQIYSYSWGTPMIICWLLLILTRQRNSSE